MTHRTFTMLKPDALEKGYVGAILDKITTAGFRIAGMKLIQMSPAEAASFYSIHRERPFFEELISYITRGPIVVAVLEKEHAVPDFRTLIGATNPADAAPATIRKLYATSISQNTIHGSDSDANAAIEIAFHFSERELY